MAKRRTWSNDSCSFRSCWRVLCWRPHQPDPNRSCVSSPRPLSRILDPHFTTSFTTRDLGYLIYDTLFAVDDTFTPKPQMVGRYTVSPDRLTYVFVLRPA